MAVSEKHLKVEKLMEYISKDEFRGFQKEINEDFSKNISLKDESGRVILHWAASIGRPQFVQWLLDNGANVDPQDDANWTPLIIASSAGHSDVVKIILGCGAHVNSLTDQGRSSIFYACSRNRLEILKVLCQSHADMNQQDKYGASPLHRAAGVGNVEVLKYLVDNYSNQLESNIKDHEGNTPLHLACEESNFYCVEALLKAGSLTSMLNKEEKTPLDVAPPEYRNKLKNMFDRFAQPQLF